MIGYQFHKVDVWVTEIIYKGTEVFTWKRLWELNMS